MSDVTPAPSPLPAVPVERFGRGVALALLTVPVGVAIWVLIWNFGFIASLVAAVVAFVALRLYVMGAGGISRVGALAVVLVTVVTLLLAFFSGIVLDAAKAFGDLSGLGAWGAFTDGAFWPSFWEVFPDALPEYLPDFGWAVAFGALGSFATLRTALAAASRPALPAPAPAGFEPDAVVSGAPAVPAPGAVPEPVAATEPPAPVEER